MAKKFFGAKRILAVSLIGATVLFSGCGKTKDSEILIVTDSTDDVNTYSTVACLKDTVKLTDTKEVFYHQGSEQEICFDEGGKRVERVYVKKGDAVSKGDLILELSNPNLEEQIENINYQLKLIQINETYFGSMMDDYAKEDTAADVAYYNKKLADLKERLGKCKVYATIDGVVHDIDSKLEGSTTRKDQVVMTIVDGADGFFMSSDADMVQECKADSEYAMTVKIGSASGEYVITPMNMETWTEEEQYFEVVSRPETVELTVDTKGNVTIPIEEKANVLCIPNLCIYEADGQKYVYMVDDEGMKTVQFIKTGLVGDEYTEIISGLEEGQQVIMQ